MSIEATLTSRANAVCELCAASEDLSVYEVPSSPGTGPDVAILLCATCKGQIEEPDTVDTNHWRCLNDSMWSPVPAVQVMAWRMLNRLRGEGWPVDLLDMMYMEPETLTWAKAPAANKQVTRVRKMYFGKECIVFFIVFEFGL